MKKRGGGGPTCEGDSASGASAIFIVGVPAAAGCTPFAQASDAASNRRSSGYCAPLVRGLEFQQLRRRAAQDHLPLRAGEVDLFEKLNGTLIAHVEAVVAPEHNALCAHRADHELHNLL